MSACTGRLAEIHVVATASFGGGATLALEDFQIAAERLGPGVSAALVRAFAEVESGGKSGFTADNLPIIAFEGHRFRQHTKGAYDRSHPGLSYHYARKAGPEWYRNNRNQNCAWQTLREAMQLDFEAALKSCSWGMFQIMGENHAACGYGTVRVFVAAMKAGARGQLEAFIGFCKQRSGMVKAMKEHDYVAMASLYNGKNFGDYDERIRKAHKKHSESK